MSENKKTVVATIKGTNDIFDALNKLMNENYPGQKVRFTYEVRLSVEPIVEAKEKSEGKP